MIRIVYGDRTPYITADERKMNEVDMALVRSVLEVDFERHFDLFVNRVLPPDLKVLGIVDHLVLNFARPFARLLGGRAMVGGTVRKAGPA